MVTAADGMPQYYNLEDNHRYETIDEAINIDKRLRTAYVGHNKVFMIQSQERFQDKIAESLSSVRSVLGLPTEKMRFKKFLIDTSNVKYSTKAE